MKKDQFVKHFWNLKIIINHYGMQLLYIIIVYPIAYCIYGLTVTCGYGTRDAVEDG